LHKGYPENTVKGFSEVPEHTGLYFKNTVKWRKGYPENTVKGFSEVPVAKWHKGYPENTVKGFSSDY
jgi:hypothetical protein